VVELLGWWGLVSGEAAASFRPIGLGLGLPLAAGVIVYTAFLFGQAEGRDLWQSPLLPVHLLVQAAMMGGGALLLLAGLFGLPAAVAEVSGAVFATALVLDLLTLLLGELGMPHATEAAAAAAHRMSRGKYRREMWLGGVVLGHVIPLFLIGVAWPGLAALFAAAGLYFYEHAYVLAPQEIPNS
jgi:formate-dependent nitrite reductase membrane component NrfD